MCCLPEPRTWLSTRRAQGPRGVLWAQHRGGDSVPGASLPNSPEGHPLARPKDPGATGRISKNSVSPTQPLGWVGKRSVWKYFRARHQAREKQRMSQGETGFDRSPLPELIFLSLPPSVSDSLPISASLSSLPCLAAHPTGAPLRLPIPVPAQPCFPLDLEAFEHLARSCSAVTFKVPMVTSAQGKTKRRSRQGLAGVKPCGCTSDPEHPIPANSAKDRASLLGSLDG